VREGGYSPRIPFDDDVEVVINDDDGGLLRRSRGLRDFSTTIRSVLSYARQVRSSENLRESPEDI